jgi:hypothetical protein
VTTFIAVAQTQKLTDAALAFLTLGPGLVTMTSALIGFLHVWGPMRRPGIPYTVLASEGMVAGTLAALPLGALLGFAGAITVLATE